MHCLQLCIYNAQKNFVPFWSHAQKIKTFFHHYAKIVKKKNSAYPRTRRIVAKIGKILIQRVIDSGKR